MKIFENLKVVELASVLAGPSVGMFFAELGADVIKFENKLVGGDVTRNWRVANESSDGLSAYFCSVNYKKRYVPVDYNDAQDLALVLTEIDSADIVICNFKEGYDVKFGLDYETLKKRNSKLIYSQLGGYASNIEKVAFDVVLQADCGFMYMNGSPDSPPTKMPLAFMDVLAAHQLKEGILIALYQRSMTGKGSYVSTTLEESSIASLVNQASNYLMTNHIPQRMGSLHPNIAPYGEQFQTQDGATIVLAIGSDKQFEKFCQVLNVDLYTKTDFSTNINRVKNRNLLAQQLEPTIISWDSEQLIQQCTKAQIPVGKVKNMQEVFQSDLARNMILVEDIDGQITKRVKSVAFNLRD